MKDMFFHNPLENFIAACSIEICLKISTNVSFLLSREISDDLGQPVNCISMSNDGNCILASCLDSTLRLLDRYILNIIRNVIIGIYSG